MTMQSRTRSNIDTMPYAIDAKLCNKGRRFAATKRRLEFHFGFGNKDAIEDGQTASECRGEEHQIVMIWSLTSGKQRVLADGVEVHFSRRSVTERFECQWTMKSGHQITVVSAWAPLAKNVRNFDLRVDGLSYWDMPKIYQLGSGVPKGASMLPLRRKVATCPQHPLARRAYSAPVTSPTSVRTVWDDLLLTPTPSMDSRNPFSSPMPLKQEHHRHHSEQQTSMEMALRSLVNMDAYTPCLSRSPSISDLSVQSAYTPQHQTMDISYRSLNAWSTPQWHPHPVYTFAG